MENQDKGAAAEAPLKWGETTIPLKFPVDQGEAPKIEKVTLREPDGEALEKIDALGLEPGKPMRVAQINGIIAALSGLPIETVRKLHRNDIRDLGEAAAPLLEAEAGGPSPEG